MFKKLFGKRAVREKWDAGLVWFRLRYLAPEGPTRCINLLSRAQACGRVALYYRPGDAVSELYLGIPETHVRLLRCMVADFGFSLKPKPPEVVIPAAGRMTAVTELSWDTAFMVHIANEFAFASLVEGENKSGSYLPDPLSGEPGRGPATWRLPDNPLPGLTLKLSWNDRQPPAHLVATEPDSQRWLLGRTQSGMPLHVAGRVNIYGRQEAVADWLVHQVSQMVTVDHTNLVVIDGVGDLVPRLKRKAAVTRLLGEQLAYVDIDGASLVGGFNPLAAAPGETEAATLQRWQRWFQGMNVHPQGIQLLAQAQQDGVSDIPTLRKWLKQVERQGQYAAVSGLRLALTRLTANRTIREWVTWPTNPWSQVVEGGFLFACRSETWEQRHLLRAMLLAASCQVQKKLIVHGFPWSAFGIEDTRACPALLISNGPPLAEAAMLLVQSDSRMAAKVGQRYLSSDPQLVENMQLLQRGEGILVEAGKIVFATWQGRLAGQAQIC
ncbi:MAG TPA: hypothetical protein PLD25_27120 [Chloroflexota bacterium]|nr:hypothetical protein [Chloroflexota bacterium]HUM67443.1 hypothetical protein [Chloroflexota bacterium]